jgi:hypothetical protein
MKKSITLVNIGKYLFALLYQVIKMFIDFLETLIQL